MRPSISADEPWPGNSISCELACQTQPWKSDSAKLEPPGIYAVRILADANKGAVTQWRCRDWTSD